MSDEPLNLKQALPPLRLVHFFAWMALTGVLLALTPVRSPSIPVWWTIVNLPAMLGRTMAIVMSTLLLFWRRRGFQVPNQPGHWIFVAFCVSLACSILLVIVNSLSVIEIPHGYQFRDPQVLTEFIHFWGWHLSVLPTIAVELWIAWRFRATKAWCSFFAACGVLMLLHVLYGPLIAPIVSWAVQPIRSATNFIHLALRFLLDANGVVTVAFMTLAIWGDRRRGIERHWSHWCGVLAWVSSLPSQLAVAAMNAGWLEYPGNLSR